MGPASARLRVRVVRLLALILFVCSASACDNASTSKRTAEQPTPTGGQPTIVSLTPSITQMLIDMGKREQIVGVSTEDKQLEGVPRCGSFNDPILARVMQLGPDLVLTESVRADAAQVPALLRQRAKQGVYQLGILPHSLSIADVQRGLADPERGLGKLVGDQPSAQRAERLMVERLQAVAGAVADAMRPRVLTLLHPQTLGTLGTGVVHAELLELAGAVNAAGQYDTGYLTLTRSQVLQTADPDVILIFEPNGRPITNNDPRLTALKDLAVPAVTNHRIVVIDHPQGLLLSTALPEVLMQIASAVHPDRTEAIRQAYDAAGTNASAQTDAQENAEGSR